MESPSRHIPLQKRTTFIVDARVVYRRVASGHENKADAAVAAQLITVAIASATGWAPSAWFPLP